MYANWQWVGWQEGIKVAHFTPSVYIESLILIAAFWLSVLQFGDMLCTAAKQGGVGVSAYDVDKNNNTIIDFVRRNLSLITLGI